MDRLPALVHSSDVGGGAPIAAHQDDGVLAIRIAQGADLDRVGSVHGLSGDKIDVVGQQGETTTFRIDQTLQNLPDANRKPQVGDTVTVVAKPDPLGSGWLAVAIVKQ